MGSRWKGGEWDTASWGKTRGRAVGSEGSWVEEERSSGRAAAVGDSCVREARRLLQV